MNKKASLKSRNVLGMCIFCLIGSVLVILVTQIFFYAFPSPIISHFRPPSLSLPDSSSSSSSSSSSFLHEIEIINAFSFPISIYYEDNESGTFLTSLYKKRIRYSQNKLQWSDLCHDFKRLECHWKVYRWKRQKKVCLWSTFNRIFSRFRFSHFQIPQYFNGFFASSSTYIQYFLRKLRLEYRPFPSPLS